MAILFWIWKTSFHSLLRLQRHLRLKTDKKAISVNPSIIHNFDHWLFRNASMLSKWKEKSTELRCANGQIFISYFWWLLLSSLLLCKWCHLSEEIVNALFLSSSNRKPHFLCASLCNRIWINLKSHSCQNYLSFHPMRDSCCRIETKADLLPFRVVSKRWEIFANIQ